MSFQKRSEIFSEQLESNKKSIFAVPTHLKTQDLNVGNVRPPYLLSGILLFTMDSLIFKFFALSTLCRPWFVESLLSFFFSVFFLNFSVVRHFVGKEGEQSPHKWCW